MAEDFGGYGRVPLPPTADPMGLGMEMGETGDTGGSAGYEGGAGGGFGRGRGRGRGGFGGGQRTEKKNFQRNEGDWDCPK